MYSALPKAGTVAQVPGKQVLRSGTLVVANYREASRRRSKAEFISKIGDSLKEIEETAYWLELLVDSGGVPAAKMADLQRTKPTHCDPKEPSGNKTLLRQHPLFGLPGLGRRKPRLAGQGSEPAQGRPIAAGNRFGTALSAACAEGTAGAGALSSRRDRGLETVPRVLKGKRASLTGCPAVERPAIYRSARLPGPVPARGSCRHRPVPGTSSSRCSPPS